MCTNFVRKKIFSSSLCVVSITLTKATTTTTTDDDSGNKTWNFRAGTDTRNSIIAQLLDINRKRSLLFDVYLVRRNHNLSFPRCGCVLLSGVFWIFDFSFDFLDGISAQNSTRSTTQIFLPSSCRVYFFLCLRFFSDDFYRERNVQGKRKKKLLIDFSAHSLHNWSLFGLAHREHLGAAHSYSTCSRYACECIRTPKQRSSVRGFCGNPLSRKLNWNHNNGEQKFLEMKFKAISQRVASLRFTALYASFSFAAFAAILDVPRTLYQHENCVF